MILPFSRVISPSDIAFRSNDNRQFLVFPTKVTNRLSETLSGVNPSCTPCSKSLNFSCKICGLLGQTRLVNSSVLNDPPLLLISVK